MFDIEITDVTNANSFKRGVTEAHYPVGDSLPALCAEGFVNGENTSSTV